jgi:hypothetical protein
MPDDPQDEVVNEPTKTKPQKQASDSSSNPVDPKAALELAQEKLAEAQFNVAEQDKRDKLDAELDKLVEAYEKEAEAVSKSEDVLKNYADAETSGLEKLLTQTGVKDVMAASKTVDDDIKQKDTIETDEGKLKTKQQEVVDSTKDRDNKKAAFERLKKGAAAIKERQRRIEALRTEIDKAESTGDFAIAYWLLVEKYQAELGSELKPIAASEYEGKVNAAWTELSTAEADLREKELALKKATKALDDLKKDIATLRKDRDANVRAELKKIRLPSPAAPAEAIDEEG